MAIDFCGEVLWWCLQEVGEVRKVVCENLVHSHWSLSMVMVTMKFRLWSQMWEFAALRVDCWAIGDDVFVQVAVLCVYDEICDWYGGPGEAMVFGLVVVVAFLICYQCFVNLCFIMEGIHEQYVVVQHNIVHVDKFFFHSPLWWSFICGVSFTQVVGY